MCLIFSVFTDIFICHIRTDNDVTWYLMLSFCVMISLVCCFFCSRGNEELINVLATLHDSLLPSLLQGLQIILAAEQKTSSSMLSDVSASLRILSTRIVDLGWRLLDNCYLSDRLFKDNVPFPAAMKMFPATVEDPVIRAEILIQTLKEIAAVRQHAQGKNYRGTYLQNIEKHHQMMQRIQDLRSSGTYLFSENMNTLNRKVNELNFIILL